MQAVLRNWWCWGLAALVLVPAGELRAQGAPVQFIAVVGEVRILGRDGAPRAAARGAELRDGESVVTGANGLAQLRFADGGMISVRGNTELKLDRFAYRGQDDRGASLFMSLLKGGFRSVTGLIGQLNRDGYKVNTPFATIGIRGTVHNPFVQLPAAAGEQIPVAPGAYDYVEQGAVAMLTPQGQTLTIGVQQTGFVSPAGVPQLLAAPPPVFRRDAPKPVPQPTPGAPKTSDARPDGGPAPGSVRQLEPGTVGPLQTAPAQTAPSPALQSPTAIQPVPSTTIQTAPLQTSPLQTSPLQTSPLQTSPLQTSPMLKPGPTAPVMPPK